MKTHLEMMDIAGPVIGEIILCDLYGNATVHENEWMAGDPCYLHKNHKDLYEKISRSHVAKYPWEGRDYATHDKFWMSFEVDGVTCFARSTGGDGTFSYWCVDAGWVVFYPRSLAEAHGVKIVSEALL